MARKNPSIEKRVEHFGEEVEALGKKAGKKLEEAVAPIGKQGEVKRLYRSGKEKVLGGVCGGIAEYLQVDPVIIRLAWVVLTLLSIGVGIIVYIICWIIVPRNPAHKWK